MIIYSCCLKNFTKSIDIKRIYFLRISHRRPNSKYNESLILFVAFSYWVNFSRHHRQKLFCQLVSWSVVFLGLRDGRIRWHCWLCTSGSLPNSTCFIFHRSWLWLSWTCFCNYLLHPFFPRRSLFYQWMFCHQWRQQY